MFGESDSIVSTVISQNEINSTHFYPIIFNGASVDDINEAKFIVQILHEERLVCAGSLIGPRTVVTAAHCVFNVPINLLDIEYGSIWAHTKRSKNIISVQNVSIHPHYADGNETFADIAAIILKEPIKRSPTVNYISLNQDRFIKKNTKVKAYGWGCTYISADRTFEKYPIKLQKTIFDTWTETQCVKIIGRTSKKNDKICVSNSKGGNCFADSGGPLVYNAQNLKNGRFNCGATLISPSTVLTAAHCINGSSEDSILIRYGTDMLKHSLYRAMKVKKITIHPYFNPKSYANDIAIIKLQQNIRKYPKYVSEIPIVDFAKLQEQELKTNSSVKVYGWGKTHINETTSRFLIRADLITWSDMDCRRDTHKTFLGIFKKRYPFPIICASNPLTSVCLGDCGSPVVSADGKLAGIVIPSGNGCPLPGERNMFIKISAYLNFIRSKIEI